MIFRNYFCKDLSENWPVFKLVNANEPGQTTRYQMIICYKKIRVIEANYLKYCFICAIHEQNNQNEIWASRKIFWATTSWHPLARIGECSETIVTHTVIQRDTNNWFQNLTSLRNLKISDTACTSPKSHTSFLIRVGANVTKI